MDEPDVEVYDTADAMSFGASDAYGVEAYYTAEGDTIRLTYGQLMDGQYRNLDIKDAVFLRYQLDGAIADYERAVGR